MSKRWVVLGVTVAALVLAGAIAVARDDPRPAEATRSSAVNTTPTTAVEACPAPSRTYSDEELAALLPQLEEYTTADYIYSYAKGPGAFHIDMWPGREALADHLREIFGDAVDIQVAGVPYCGHAVQRPGCPTLLGSDDLPDGLHLRLDLEKPSMAAGDSIRGQLFVRNDGAPLQFGAIGKTLAAFIVERGTGQVVGFYSGSISAVGLNMAQAQLVSPNGFGIEVVVGAAACGVVGDSTLEPGVHGVRAGLVDPYDDFPDYLAPEVPLQITG